MEVARVLFSLLTQLNQIHCYFYLNTPKSNQDFDICSFEKIVFRELAHELHLRIDASWNLGSCDIFFGDIFKYFQLFLLISVKKICLYKRILHYNRT